MNRGNYSEKKRNWGCVGLFSLALAMLEPQQAAAGEAEAAAALLLGTAIVVAIQDDRPHHQVRYVHYGEHRHSWRYRHGRRYCDAHNSFHYETGHRHGHYRHHGYAGHKYYYPQHHRNHHRNSLSGPHHGKSRVHGEVHYHAGGRHGHKVEMQRSSKPGRQHAEARWNTRVRAY